MAKKGRSPSNLPSKPKDGAKAGGPAVKPKPKSRRARRIVEAREPKLVSPLPHIECSRRDVWCIIACRSQGVCSTQAPRSK